MKLYEFFGTFSYNTGKNKDEDKKVQEEGLAEDIFEYIINNDKLQKTEFFPIAEKIFREATKEQKANVWLPMVNKGCMEYYRFKEMKDNPNKVFTKELRERLCNRIAEHYQSDILKGTYQLGEGVVGSIAGGIAGAAITKTPSGAATGAKIGGDIQDYFTKQEGTDPGMAKLFSWKAEVLKAYPELAKQIKFLSKPDSTISAEIPGQDRSYGVFDLASEEGEVLGETTQRLDPKCWKGYRKAGTKMKGGVRVNNCVPIEGVAEISDNTLKSYQQKVSNDTMKHKMDPTKRSPEKASRSVSGFARAQKRLEKGVAEGSEKNVVKSVMVGNFRHDLVDTGFSWQVRIYNGDQLYDAGLSKNSEQKGLAALDAAVSYTKKQLNIKEHNDQTNNCVKIGEGWEQKLSEAVQRLGKR